MQESVILTGIILKQSPVGEYDRRVSLLTKERGKITAFARGARRPGNKLAAATDSFAFGHFKVYEGKSAYTLTEADVHNYFEDLRIDYVGACYGMYFAEVADYYAHENNDEREMLKLLYQSLRALCSPVLSRPLVRCVFECRCLVVNGEFPGPPDDRPLGSSTLYVLQYIASSPLDRLFSFAVSESVLEELRQVSTEYMRKYVGHAFKSLEVLQTLC